MKKIIAYFISLFMILLGASIILVSCKTSKKILSTEVTKSTEKTQKDSIKNVVVNQTINDKLITPVFESKTGKVVFDSLVNAKVDEILSKLNTSKSSGENEYKLYYNQLKKQLEFYAKIAETKNENTSTKSNVYKEQESIKQEPVIIEKPLTNIQKFFIGLGVGFLAYQCYRLFIFVKSKTSIV